MPEKAIALAHEHARQEHGFRAEADRTADAPRLQQPGPASEAVAQPVHRDARLAGLGSGARGMPPRLREASAHRLLGAPLGGPALAATDCARGTEGTRCDRQVFAHARRMPFLQLGRLKFFSWAHLPPPRELRRAQVSAHAWYLPFPSLCSREFFESRVREAPARGWISESRVERVARLCDCAFSASRKGSGQSLVSYIEPLAS